MMGDPEAFLVSAIFLIPAVLIAIPLHEMGHALAAYLQGDRSVRHRGGFELNPRRFIEPYGFFAAFFLRVGWGQAVQINEGRLRGAWGRVAYALAGPAANLLLAAVFGAGLRTLWGQPVVVTFFAQPPQALLAAICYAIFFFNLSMFAFNLLPIPGLDGWRILEVVLRSRYPRFFFDAWMRRREIWGVCAVVVFVTGFIGVNVVGSFIFPFYQPAASVILGVCSGYPGLNPCRPLGF